MGSGDRPLTASERARLAYELMVYRQLEAAVRLRSQQRSRAVLVAVLCAGLGALVLGSAIYNNWLPTSLRSATLMRKADDGNFGETRTAPVRSFIKGNTCRELEFNNDRGAYIRGSLIPCEVETKRLAPPPIQGDRVNSIRDVFTTR